MRSLALNSCCSQNHMKSFERIQILGSQPRSESLQVGNRHRCFDTSPGHPGAPQSGVDKRGPGYPQVSPAGHS